MAPQKDHSAKHMVQEGVRKSKITVNKFRRPENKTALKHAASILKHDVIGLFSEVRNILQQTEDLQSYANCKNNPTCSDAIEKYKVHIPPMYDEVLTDEPKKPTPGAATVDAIVSAASASAEILDDAGNMQAYANRHQNFPGDPTKFDPDRPKSLLFREREDEIRQEVQVVETAQPAEATETSDEKIEK